MIPINGAELIQVGDREQILIGKIAVLERLTPWVIARLKPVVDLTQMLDDLKSELEALTTQN